MCPIVLNMSSFGVRNAQKFQQFNSIEDIELFIFHEFGTTRDNYFLLCNGRKLLKHDKLNEMHIVHIVPKILGGKGGFGSMLRAIGAQIEKTTNREACRDLSGRRLRDINEEQRLKNWIAQQADREREAAERKKKKLERLCREPKHDFNDDNYNQARAELSEKVSDSVEQGFKASGSQGPMTGVKRKECSTQRKTKKKRLLIDIEDDSSSNESESSENCAEKIVQDEECKEPLPNLQLQLGQTEKELEDKSIKS